MAASISDRFRECIGHMGLADLIEGDLANQEYCPVDWTRLYKAGLLFFYSAGVADRPLRQSDCAVSAGAEPDDRIIGHFFLSDSTCQYIQGITLHETVPKDVLLWLCNSYLHREVPLPSFSLQLLTECDPSGLRAVDQGVAAAVEVIEKTAHWEVETHVVMVCDLQSAPVPDPIPKSDELEWLPVESWPEEQRPLMFETIEKICADSFQYPYDESVTCTHFRMHGATDPSALVQFHRTLFRRRSDNLFVAYASYMTIRGLPAAYIAELGVLSAHQGQGIGRFIVHSLLAHFKQQGFGYALLTATAEGLNLYLKTGFKTTTSANIYCIYCALPDDDASPTTTTEASASSQ